MGEINFYHILSNAHNVLFNLIYPKYYYFNM